MNFPAIDAQRAGFSYRGTGHHQLSRISFRVAAGERLAIMGATGAGKTTLAMMLNGLVPHHHPGDLYGQILVDGVPTHTVGMNELVKHVGLVMQDPEAQITARRALDDAAVGPANLGIPRTEVWRRAKQAIHDVGLGGLEDRDTSQMSGGQQQRLAIAGIIAMSPEILVLDEPTSELDPAGTQEVYRIIENQLSKGRSVILIDHDSDKVFSWADKLLVLAGGELEFFGTPTEFFSDGDRVRKCGLRQPAEFELLEVAVEEGLLRTSNPERFDPVVSLNALQEILPSRDQTTEIEAQPSESTRSVCQTLPAIEVHELSHRYPSGVLALDQIDLRIAKGEFVALLGKNGAGKTTFARHLVNLLTPTSGSVLINGEDTLGKKVHELASQVGYVFQNPDHQIFANTVFDEVAFGLRNSGIDEDEIHDRVYEVLERVSMEKTVESHPFTLGRGERQRVAVASVLALKPDILVIDEPTTGQDWQGSVSILELVRQLNEEGKTIVMITHDMLLASQYARRAVVFRSARVAIDVPMSDLFTDTQRIHDLNLEVPALTALSIRLGLRPVHSREQLRAELARCSHAS